MTDESFTPARYQPLGPRDMANRKRKTAANYDFSCNFGPLDSDRPWPMYSYERPANILWGAISAELAAKGWTEKQIKTWLQSADTRHALDSVLGDAIHGLAVAYAGTITR